MQLKHLIIIIIISVIMYFPLVFGGFVSASDRLWHTVYGDCKLLSVIQCKRVSESNLETVW